MRRVAAALAATAGLGLLVAGVGPWAAIQAGDRAVAAATQPLPDRLAAADEARGWYRLARAAPPWERAARAREDALDQGLAAAFDVQRRTLQEGAAGAAAHLSWLQQRAAARDPAQADRARQELLVALASYGRADEALAVQSDRDTPALAAWRALAAVHEGQPDRVRAQLLDAPGLALWTSQPPLEGEALATIVAAERRRRGRDPAAARALLAPLLQLDHPLAPLAAHAWGLGLVDELRVEPEGLLQVAVADQGPDPRAVATLQALLLAAPADDPAWLGAWLCLAEVAFRGGDPAAGEQAAWAAIEASLPTWAAPAADLPAMARLDAPGSVHPERVQRVRVALDELRAAAEARGDSQAGPLRDGVVALLLVQARAQLAARNRRAAQGLLDRALLLAPDSPAVATWLALHAALADDAAQAQRALATTTLPEASRAVLAGWIDPPAPPWTGSAAQALHGALSAPWPPGAPLAWARAHAHQADDLALALAAPVADRADPALSLAQAHLAVRVATALGAPTDQATARRDRLQEQALDEPLWGLYTAGAFTVHGPALDGQPQPRP